MQSLDYIKRRIKTVKTTSKITGAMKLIATAKMTKQRNNYEKIKSFFSDFYNLLSNFANSIKVKKIDESKPILYVLISSSLGLCGAYNSNVSKKLISVLKLNDKIIVFGKKGYSFLKSRNYKDQIILQTEFLEGSSYLEILPITEVIIQAYKNQEFSCVKLVYTKYVNSMSFNPEIIRILPFDKVLFEQNFTPSNEYKEKTDLNQVIEYDSTKQQIFESSISIYVSTLIYASIIESMLSETSSRKNAMKSATDNANELINDLQLIYNRLRQEKITQEINEIVGGYINEK